jgi:hypothetical protein
MICVFFPSSYCPIQPGNCSTKHASLYIIRGKYYKRNSTHASIRDYIQQCTIGDIYRSFFRLAAKHVVIDAKPIETKGDRLSITQQTTCCWWYIRDRHRITLYQTCVNDIIELAFIPQFSRNALRSFSHMSVSFFSSPLPILTKIKDYMVYRRRERPAYVSLFQLSPLVFPSIIKERKYI